MDYLIFTDEIVATNRNRQISAGQGCGLNIGDVTLFLFGIIRHPYRSEWALAIPPAQQGLLTPAEIAALQSEATLEAADWFIFEEEV